MKLLAFKHLLFTWLVAQLLHPVMFLVYCKSVQGNQLFFAWDDPSSVSAFSAFGMMMSVPATLISMISLRIMMRSALSAGLALLTWSLIVPLSIVAGGSIVLNFAMGFFDPTLVGIFVPAMMAGIVAVLIRYKQFIKLIRYSVEKQTRSYGEFYYRK